MAETGAELSTRLCAGYRDAAAPVIENSCRRCAALVGPHLVTSAGCVHCRRDRFAFEGVIRLGVYDGLLGSACLRTKHPRGRPLAAVLAGLLWERDRAVFEAADIDVVVPVPQHWSGRFLRGHNAAETIGEVLASRLKVDFFRHILSKVRRTPAQTSLPPSRRRSNLRGAFRVRGRSPLAGETVLLTDNILTTGTTANEVARMLWRGGAERVIVAVAARGIGR